jgi:divalent metal cation (Fe/Co/Zn/Cd) transporter
LTKVFTVDPQDLKDGFEKEQLEVYRNSIFGISGVKGIKTIRAKKYGNNLVVDVVIMVNSTLSIGTVHDISEQVEDLLIKDNEVFEVYVHVEPNLKNIVMFVCLKPYCRSFE